MSTSPHAPSNPNGVTVLQAFTQNTVKTYRLDANGQLEVIPYLHEHAFRPTLRTPGNIRELGNLIQELSTQRNVVIIRGQQTNSGVGFIGRNSLNYREPEGGLRWAMLDFDDVPLPEGCEPLSIEAIEHIVRKLPEPFHRASYFYQFSSSAGICQPDGAPLKNGLNVHLFFWFAQPISGYLLGAYLKDHCISTQFYELTTNRGGIPAIRYGVDFALFRDVQPHYVAAPIIADGVVCTLQADARQGLIEKQHAAVGLPAIDASLARNVEGAHQALSAKHKRSCGWVPTRAVITTRDGGIGIHHYHRSPDDTPVTPGKVFREAEVEERVKPSGETVKYCKLFFEDEQTPGSWWVSTRNPTLARRFGDYAELPLEELSPTAYVYVRDTLRWFSAAPQQRLSLTEAGFLPDLESFATARNSLILAPTGSGKTTAFCRYAAHNRYTIIIYAAQTIALTRQMAADLRASGVRVVHYRDFNKHEVEDAVYVTTNESLAKILRAVTIRGRNYRLVIDEAHAALDDFLRKEKKNLTFEQAIGRAERTIFMTATMSDVQLQKVASTISYATGELTAENYGYYEFAPVKRNPLWRAALKDFWPAFVALLRHYRALKEGGEPIPRTIVIASTSKMEAFRLLLDRFGLSEEAAVVSRQESFETEIEAARVGSHAILISSPLFALGLNFDTPPRVLWAYFRDIQVDESQIVQTLNRANRTAEPCEVRLYAGTLDASPYWIPAEKEESARIDGYFGEESSISGDLDPHLQIDRLTYDQQRAAEKNTAKALHRLVTEDRIQNYTVTTEWAEYLDITEEDRDLAKATIKEARAKYDIDILDELPALAGDTEALLAHHLDQNFKEQSNYLEAERLPKDYADAKKALSMALAKTQSVSVGKKISTYRLRCLLGESTVFLSHQFEPSRFADWMKVASEKTRDLAVLVEALVALKTGKADGIAFGWAMRRKLPRRAVLASAVNDRDYIRLEKVLDKLDKLDAEYRDKAGTSRRKALDELAFQEAREYLETLGITFDKTDRKFDPKKPIVPDWDFRRMHDRLLIKAASLKQMPREPIDREVEEQKWLHGNVSNALCRQCVHCEPYYFCALGRPIQPVWDGYEADTEKCDGFKKVPSKLIERFDLPPIEW